jgi:3-hydroxyacyl-[acyl-carrier-protein] dehydratase
MVMDIHRILKKLPHRYPILLVDRVLELEKGVRIRALKNVSINEPFFTGHFPKRPVMPGVLMLEALAQTAALLSFETAGQDPDDNTVYYFVGSSCSTCPCCGPRPASTSSPPVHPWMANSPLRPS